MVAQRRPEQESRVLEVIADCATSASALLEMDYILDVSERTDLAGRVAADLPWMTKCGMC